MKKFILILSVLSFLFFIAGCSQPSGNTNQDSTTITSGDNPTGGEQTQNKVLKKEIYEQILANGTRNLYTITDYDNKGNPTRSVSTYSNSTTATLIYQNDYDENGYFTGRVVTQDGTVVWTDEYENNSQGIPTKCTTINSSTLKAIYSYDENGLAIEMKSYNQNQLTGITNWEYDDNGNTTKCIGKDKDGNVVSVQEYTYRDMKSYDRISYTLTSNGTVQLTRTFTNTYQLDSDGYVTHVETLDNSGLKEISDYEYY